nr:Beta-adaptin appendage, C-terminal subdomain containing protein [Ipomoea trifida]
MQLPPLKHLVGLFQTFLGFLCGLVNKQSITFPLASMRVYPERAALNLPEFPEKIPQPLCIGILRHIAHGFDRSFSVLEDDKSIAFTIASLTVGDNIAVVNFSVGLEGREEGVAGDVEAKAVDKDLAVGDIRVGGGADKGEERGVLEGSIDGEGDKLVLGVGFKEGLDILRRRFGIGNRILGRGKVGGIGIVVNLLDFLLMRFGSFRFLNELSLLGHGRR